MPSPNNFNSRIPLKKSPMLTVRIYFGTGSILGPDLFWELTPNSEPTSSCGQFELSVCACNRLDPLVRHGGVTGTDVLMTEPIATALKFHPGNSLLA